jgi:hypothetical protein
MEWDDEFHGQEIFDEATYQQRVGSEVALIDWVPGRYSFSVGSMDTSIDFLVPEFSFQPSAQKHVLKGIHAFLREAYDESRQAEEKIHG